MIAKYSENTTPQNRWSIIFQYEYFQLIYFRSNGYNDVKYREKLQVTSQQLIKACLAGYAE